MELLRSREKAYCMISKHKNIPQFMLYFFNYVGNTGKMQSMKVIHLLKYNKNISAS